VTASWIDNIPAPTPEQLEERLAASVRAVRTEVPPGSADCVLEQMRRIWGSQVDWSRIVRLAEDG
jgi:hypothetical protein